MTARAATLALLLAAGPAAADPSTGARPLGAWGAVQVGYGDGGWVYSGNGYPFSEQLARNPLHLAGAIEGSAALTGSLLGGLRLSCVYLAAGGDDARTTLAITRLHAVATWRPFRAGPYGRIGAGPAGLWYDVRIPGLASGRAIAGGAGLTLAAGLFWPVGDRLELRVEANAGADAWLPSSRGPEYSWTFGGTAGFAWR